jgi:hypothetical protein
MLLDAKQSDMLARAAALLPPAQQDGFRQSVHGVLDALLVRPPTDAAMRDTLRNVLAARGGCRRRKPTASATIAPVTIFATGRRGAKPMPRPWHDKEMQDATHSLFQSRR